MNEIALKLSGGSFCLTVGTICGSGTSDLHYGSLTEFLEAGGDEADESLNDEFGYGRYEGAIDALESFVLAAHQAGIDVQSEQFAKALQTTLDAIGSQL